jgi:hypothetical protein
VLQQLKWAAADTRRRWTDRATPRAIQPDPFNPRLSSSFNFNFTQPLLRDFRIDSARQQLLVAQKQEDIVNLELQQQITLTTRNVRTAYYDLIGAIKQLEVAQRSLDLANESLKNNTRRVEVGTIPPIDIVEAQAEVSRNEEGVIISAAQVKALEDVLRTLVMNPVAAGLLDGTADAVRGAGPDAARRKRRRSGPQRTRKRIDLTQQRRRMDQTDITIKYAPQPAAARGERDRELWARRRRRIAHAVRDERKRLSRPNRVEGGTKLQRCVARYLRQRVQDVEPPVAGELPDWHQRADAGYAQAKLQREQETTSLQAMESCRRRAGSGTPAVRWIRRSSESTPRRMR